MRAMTVRGTPVARREDRALLTTGGLFVADRRLPGARRVTYVTSTMAHAQLLGVDVDAARRAPGVLDVVVAADLDGLGPEPLANPQLDPAMRRPLLATDRVRFVGEPIAAVVAEDAYLAADAAGLVEVDYAPLPVVVDPEAALARDAPQLFEGAAAGNRAVHLEAPGLGADFAGCEVTVSLRIVNNRVAACPLETRVAASTWEDGRLVHYSAGQGTHPVRDALARLYGLDPSAVRVVAQDVGGSFGAKSRPHVEEALLPFLARRVGRPVVWVPDRSADMVGLSHGRGQVQHVRIGGGRDGRIRAYEVHVLQEAGAYPGGGAMLPGNTKVMLTGCYDIPTAGFSADAVVTNTTPVGAYRGAGRPEAAAALERAVDHFARAVGVDPAEVRRRNFLPPDRFPLTTLSGTPYDSGDYAAALDRVLAASGYDELRAEQARRRAAGERWLLGIGLATYVERTAGIFRPDYGAVELLGDGRLRAITGSSPYGQGHHTAWAMLVSDRTGVPLERIEVVHGDTDVVPRGGITGGSRSVQSNGVAMWRAAGRLVEEARRLAAELLEANVDDVVADTARGAFHVVGTPARALDWAELAARASAGGQAVGPLGSVGSVEAGNGAGSDDHRILHGILHGEEDFEAAGPTFPFGAHVAVVEVDVETGEVRLRRLVAVDDAGTILNPLLADGQVHGGLAQGAAQALWEGFAYDSDGNPLTATFADYGIVSAAELPSFERVPMETPTPLNELGAKGIGESGTVGATPAVQNAVIDAVAHLGVEHLDMPLLPQVVWAAMRSAGASRGRSGPAL
jgi:aerobic carbon-monoxide dehydrogenase large subunit